MSHNVVNENGQSGDSPLSNAVSITFLHEVGSYRGKVTLHDGERLELEFHQRQSCGHIDHLFERHVIERHGRELRWELYTEVEDDLLCDGPFGFTEIRVCDLDSHREGQHVGVTAAQLPHWSEPYCEHR